MGTGDCSLHAISDGVGVLHVDLVSELIAIKISFIKPQSTMTAHMIEPVICIG